MAVINTNDVVGYVGGLLNIAEWKLLDDIVTTASSQTVTSATGAFTQVDKGKYFSIANAGTNNGPLVGYISSVTNSTTIVLSVFAIVSLTSARMQYGGKSDDPRHPLWKITRAVLQKDFEVCHAILKTPNHPRRNFFAATTNNERAQTGLPLPVISHEGELLAVQIKHTDNVWRVGKQLPETLLPQLISWIQNRSSLFTAASQGYYIIHNGQLYFTGTFIKEMYVDLILGLECQAPSEYSSIIALLAAAECFLTEGDDTSASAALAQLGGVSLVELIGGQSQ